MTAGKRRKTINLAKGSVLNLQISLFRHSRNTTTSFGLVLPYPTISRQVTISISTGSLQEPRPSILTNLLLSRLSYRDQFHYLGPQTPKHSESRRTKLQFHPRLGTGLSGFCHPQTLESKANNSYLHSRQYVTVVSYRIHQGQQIDSSR